MEKNNFLKQAPDNRWIILKDTYRYGLKKKSDGNYKLEPNLNNLMLGRISQVIGDLVFIKDIDKGFVPHLKLSGSDYGKYIYVPLKDEKTQELVFEPYYAWVIRNESKIIKENPDLVNKAKSKMGEDVVAMIKSNEYTFAFNGKNNTDLSLTDDLDDDILLSISGDGLDIYKVKKDNTPIFLYDKLTNKVLTTNKRLKKGQKVQALYVTQKDLQYKLPEMLNFDNNLFIPLKYLKKSSDNKYVVDVASRPIKIYNGKISPIKNPLDVGTELEGKVTKPIVQKNFSFVVLEDNDKQTFFVKKNHLESFINDLNYNYILNFSGVGNYLNKNLYKLDLASNFEGGDLEDFRGGYYPFDSNSLNDLDLLNSDLKNAKEIFNIDGEELVIGFDDKYNDYIYIEIFDLEKNEEKSNAVGDWFKNLFSKKDKKDKKITESDAKKLSDKNKVEYKPEELKELYEKSGSKKPFKEWIKSDETKKMLKNFSLFGLSFLEKLGETVSNKEEEKDKTNNINDKNKKNDENENKFLHPVTLGIISSLLIITIGIGIYIKNKK
jgi:hypothetical protein